MRKVSTRNITDLVSALCIRANIHLRRDVLLALKKARRAESNRRAAGALDNIIENARIAEDKMLPICQDTGMVAVFMEVGRGVEFTGGSLKKAVDAGVMRGYIEGYLRQSVVASAVERVNTKTNTPAVLHVEITEGDSVKIYVMPKGFGSENKSAVRMLNPTDGEKGISEFVLDVVKDAGPEACPPFILGIGIGGTFEYAALLSKKALLRDIGKTNSGRKMAILEKRILKSVNALGIGAMGFGGRTTALGVNVLDYPTHIAGLPVAVNVCCHALRTAKGVI